MRYQARQCTDDTCRLRFPVAEGSELGRTCPRCGKPTTDVDEPWSTPAAPGPEDRAGPRLRVLIDNVRSLRNVGSIFRTADGAGVEHVYLGGITATPDHPKLAKTALGAERTVPWTHGRDPVALAAELAASGHRLWAMEGGTDSANLLDPDVLGQAVPGPVVLVLGHEVSGVDPRILRHCERTVHLPMAGHKTSLNVSVAFAVAAYAIRCLSRPLAIAD